MLDYSSLLLAIGFAGICLSVTMFVTWLSSRTEGFLLTWAVGVAFLVADVFAYSAYVQAPRLLYALPGFGLLTAGLSVIYGAARQFRLGRLPVIGTAVTAVATTLPVVVFTVLGYDGLALMLLNVVAAGLLWATAFEYWLGRHEAPVPIAGLAAFYILCGLSFALCGAVLIADGKLAIGHAPGNWAEDLSIVVCIASLTGIGALSLALNQWRLAGRHRRDALTDPLTGLLNRRALFDRHGGHPLAPQTALVIFDLDHFKDVNDQYGHAVGDQILRHFAQTVRTSVRGADIAARIGGEEFALVLPDTTAEQAVAVAERVRGSIAAAAIETDKGRVSYTVSAGVAHADGDDFFIDSLLGNADRALYRAKDAGRNRVVPPLKLLR